MARGAYISREIVEGILMLHKVNPELKYTKIAEVYPVDASTVGKIIVCGSWEGYCRFKDEKAAKQRERKKNAEAMQKNINKFKDACRDFGEGIKEGIEQLELQGGVDYQVQVNEQLAGQMKMDLPEEKTEMSDTVKMMRLIASQADKIVNQGKMNEEVMKRLWTKQDEQLKVMAGVLDVACKICDYLGQILRVIGPEGGRN